MITQMSLFDNLWPDDVNELSQKLKSLDLFEFDESYTIWEHVPQYGYRYWAEFNCKREVAEIVVDLVNNSSNSITEFDINCSYLTWLNKDYPYYCLVYSIERRCKNGKKV